MSDLPDSGAGVAEEGDDKVSEKIDPQGVLRKQVLPHLRCMKCQAFFRGAVYRCENGHSTCSLCSIYICPIEDCNHQTSTHCVGENCALIVRNLELDVPCKNRETGCGHKAAEEKLMLHEDECGYRTVYPCPLRYFECTEHVQFQHLIDHLKEKHGIDDKINKWALADKLKVCLVNKKYDVIGHHNLYRRAYKFENGPDGKLFFTAIAIVKEEVKGLTSYGSVHVMGGKQEAKKYRAEFRVSSNEAPVSVTHSGPIFPVDVLDWYFPQGKKDCFEMSAHRFEFFNHGQIYFGEHNKDKNGEYVLPIEPKIIKKELGLTPD